MSQSIITLGIGGTADLDWFVTTGLHMLPTAVEVATYTATLQCNVTPAASLSSNPSPSVQGNSNPSPTEELMSG